jgi:hypothetical protein
LEEDAMSEENALVTAVRHHKDRAWAVEKLIASGGYDSGRTITDLINDAQAIVDFVQEDRAPGKFGAIAAPSLASVDETFRAAPRITNPMINRAKAVLDAELTSNVRVEVIRRALEAALTAEPTA